MVAPDAAEGGAPASGVAAAPVRSGWATAAVEPDARTIGADGDAVADGEPVADGGPEGDGVAANHGAVEDRPGPDGDESGPRVTAVIVPPARTTGTTSIRKRRARCLRMYVTWSAWPTATDPWEAVTYGARLSPAAPRPATCSSLPRSAPRPRRC
ncbi:MULTISPECIES: hypothetical protein [Streptomyces]|uniref:hypothetical protein n=1 Tax=Streptomyces TaxID=1883 RepID=UPI00117CFDE3|nr:hypothetical protein [Streptomyces sp. OK228]